MPLELLDAAKPWWNELAPVLTAMRVLTVADVHALARLCNLHHRYKVLSEFLMTKGASGTTVAIRDEKGKVKGVVEVPQSWEYRQIHSLILQHEAQLGLTPSARTRLRVEQGTTAAAVAPASKPLPERDVKLRDFFAGGGPAQPKKVEPA